MRRASALVILLFIASAALAAEPNLRRPDRPAFENLRHVIVHAAGPLTPEDRAELAKKGVLIQRAITNGRYFARVAAGVAVADARLTAIEAIAPEKKIAPSALREARSGRTWSDLTVYFHEDVTIEEARSALLAAGAALEDPFVLSFGPTNRLSARVAPSSLGALAADDRVVAVTGPIRFKIVSDNARSAALSRVNEVQAAPYGLTGAGVTASLFELAVAQADHVEFGGRMTLSNVSGGTSSDARHATHVAGTIGASGVNPDAKGMAPAVKIIQLCVRTPGNNCRNNYLNDKNNALPGFGVRVDNNSWGYQLGWEQEDYPVWNFGEDYYGAYELELTSAIDDIANKRDILFIHSAGNEGANPFFNEWGQHRHVDDNLQTITGKIWCYSINGSGTDCPAGDFCNGDPAAGSPGCEKTRHHPQTPYDTLGFTAAGKNTIAVGAVQILGENLDIAGFSSRGPAKDGRVKPDVVARGYGVLSSVPTNSYGSSNGTSMAAPAVTGIAALLVEQWRKTFGADPNAMQLKALLIAGADDVGRPGPDYTFGFGLVNAKKSIDLIRDDSGIGQRIRNLSIGQGDTEEIPLVVSAAQDLRVVLQWADPSIPLVPGEWIAPKALVNDLDMKVVGPNGTEYLPYVLNKDQFEANATTGVNAVDNTEQVEIKSAAPGVYRVVVTGKSVREAPPQRAVVVSSVRTAAPCVDFTESRNENASAPYGNLVTGARVDAAICSAADVDHFSFRALPGTFSVAFTTRDVALSVTLSGGVNTTATIPANTTQTITGTVAGTGAAAINMRVAASGALGAEPFYSFTPTFKQESGKRRRSARH